MKKDKDTADIEELVECVRRAEMKLAAYVGFCKDDKELTGAVLPMLREVLSRHAAEPGEGENI